MQDSTITVYDEDGSSSVKTGNITKNYNSNGELTSTIETLKKDGVAITTITAGANSALENSTIRQFDDGRKVISKGNVTENYDENGKLISTVEKTQEGDYTITKITAGEGSDVKNQTIKENNKDGTKEIIQDGKTYQYDKDGKLIQPDKETTKSTTDTSKTTEQTTTTENGKKTVVNKDGTTSEIDGNVTKNYDKDGKLISTITVEEGKDSKTTTVKGEKGSGVEDTVTVEYNDGRKEVTTGDTTKSYDKNGKLVSEAVTTHENGYTITTVKAVEGSGAKDQVIKVNDKDGTKEVIEGTTHYFYDANGEYTGRQKDIPPYTWQSLYTKPVTEKAADLTADDLNEIFEYWAVKSNNPDSPLRGAGQYFIDAAEKTGLDPLFLVGICGKETGYGSTGAMPYMNNHNFFGIDYIDDSTGWGNYNNLFTNDADGIMAAAERIRSKYVDEHSANTAARFDWVGYAYPVLGNYGQNVANIMQDSLDYLVNSDGSIMINSNLPPAGSNSTTTTGNTSVPPGTTGGYSGVSGGYSGGGSSGSGGMSGGSQVSNLSNSNGMNTARISNLSNTPTTSRRATDAIIYTKPIEKIPNDDVTPTETPATVETPNSQPAPTSIVTATVPKTNSVVKESVDVPISSQIDEGEKVPQTVTEITPIVPKTETVVTPQPPKPQVVKPKEKINNPVLASVGLATTIATAAGGLMYGNQRKEEKEKEKEEESDIITE